MYVFVQFNQPVTEMGYNIPVEFDRNVYEP